MIKYAVERLEKVLEQKNNGFVKELEELEKLLLSKETPEYGDAETKIAWKAKDNKYRLCINLATERGDDDCWMSYEELKVVDKMKFQERISGFVNSMTRYFGSQL